MNVGDRVRLDSGDAGVVTHIGRPQRIGFPSRLLPALITIRLDDGTTRVETHPNLTPLPKEDS